MRLVIYHMYIWVLRPIFNIYFFREKFFNEIVLFSQFFLIFYFLTFLSELYDKIKIL